MKKSIEQITFTGYDEVFYKIETKENWFFILRRFLNREIEIPIVGFVAVVLCWLAILSFSTKDKNFEHQIYDIVVITSRGEYEIY